METQGATMMDPTLIPPQAIQGQDFTLSEDGVFQAEGHDPIGGPATKEAIIEMVKTVYDPEIPVDIYELGLIYDVELTEDGVVRILMTLTAPGCPVAGSLPGAVAAKAASVPGVKKSEIELVWEPAWHMDMMSEDAKLALDLAI